MVVHLPPCESPATRDYTPQITLTLGWPSLVPALEIILGLEANQLTTLRSSAQIICNYTKIMMLLIKPVSGYSNIHKTLVVIACPSHADVQWLLAARSRL